MSFHRSLISLLVASAASCLVLSAGAQAQSSLQVQRLEPASPATLQPGDSVEVVYEYDLRAEKPFRISVTPLTDGQPSAERKVSPVQQYDSAEGTGRALLSLEAGGTVDELLLLAQDAGSAQLLAKRTVSVDYTFEAVSGGPATAPILPVTEPLPSPSPDLQARPYELSRELAGTLGGYRPPRWRLPPEQTDVPQAENEIPACGREARIEPRSCEEVAGRRITDGGVLVVDCADGSTWRTTPDKEIFTTPDGRSCRFLRMTLYSTHVAPAEVPEILGGNQELESWLREYVAGNLLRQIEALVGDEYFDEYQSMEEQSTPQNVYQEIDLRLAFLDKLLDGR